MESVIRMKEETPAEMINSILNFTVETIAKANALDAILYIYRHNETSSEVLSEIGKLIAKAHEEFPEEKP